MTNAEKFREVFHIEPAKYSVPWSCDGVLCKNCSYYNEGCDASQWWNEEYKELDLIADLNEKVEPTTLAVDCVSKQSVAEYIDYIQNHGMGKKKSFDYIGKFVAKLPPVTPQPRWIPISERMPEEQGLYLVTIKSGDKYYIDTDLYNTLYKKGFRTPNVIAWMPLPQPYRKVEE